MDNVSAWVEEIGVTAELEKFASSVIAEGEDYIEKMATERKSHEQDLFDKWKHTNKTKYFQELYTSMKPLISKAIRNASFNSNIPQSAHQAYAAQNFYNALKTFDPKHGVLQTHVYGSVGKKAHRLNALYQNLGHAPEPRAQMAGRYLDAKEYLKNQLDREPSAAELADHMSIGISKIGLLEKEIHKDLALDDMTEQQTYFMTDANQEKLEFLYYDLSGEEQVVYDYIMGAHGKPRMTRGGGKRVDFDGIAQKMGVSSSKVRNIHKKIARKLERIK